MLIKKTLFRIYFRIFLALSKNNENIKTAVPSSDDTKMEEDPIAEDEKKINNKVPTRFIAKSWWPSSS